MSTLTKSGLNWPVVLLLMKFGTFGKKTRHGRQKNDGIKNNHKTYIRKESSNAYSKQFTTNA